MSGDAEDALRRMAVNLGTASARTSVRAGTAMGKALNDIRAGAMTRAPVDTGALRNSVTTAISRDGNTIRGEVGPTVNYAGFVERGTSRQRAQPYLRPATDAVLPGYHAALSQLGMDVLGD